MDSPLSPPTSMSSPFHPRERHSSIPDLSIDTPLTTTQSPDTQSITPEQWHMLNNNDAFITSPLRRERSLIHDFNYFNASNSSHSAESFFADRSIEKSPMKEDWNAKIESEFNYYEHHKKETIYNDDAELNNELMKSKLLPEFRNDHNTNSELKIQEDTLSYTNGNAHSSNQFDDALSMTESHSVADSHSLDSHSVDEIQPQPERKYSLRETRRLTARAKRSSVSYHGLSKNERNNIAALKYRAKKKQEELEMRQANQRMTILLEQRDQEIEHLSAENKILKEQVSYLTSKVDLINDKLRTGQSCAHELNHSSSDNHQSPSVASTLMSMLSSYLLMNPQLIESKLGIKLTAEQLMQLQKSAYQPLTKVFGSIAVNQALHQISTSLMQIQTPRPIAV